MFIAIIIVILLISFVLALKSLRSLNEKPGIKEVKKSLDKDRVIYHSRASSS
jgi:hypothetical protein